MSSLPASDDRPQPDNVKIVTIDPTGDVILTCKDTHFRVSKAVLVDASQYFKGMFRANNFAESKPGATVKLEGSDLKAFQVILNVLHKVTEPGLLEVNIETVWQVAGLCNKYMIELKLVKTWFAMWYSHNEDTLYCRSSHKDYKCHASELLYPTYIFNHAAGFTLATKHLVYNTGGHIVERNPTNLRYLHLPPRVIQQLNGAKGRLRNVLQKALWEPIAPLFKHAHCQGKEATVFAYQAKLYAISVWPLEVVAPRESMTVIFGRLDTFDYPLLPADCHWCSEPFADLVKAAKLEAAKYFDGLCLDCINRDGRNNADKIPYPSDDADHSDSSDYWTHYRPGDHCDKYCRVKHGEPTCYFSYMARKDRETWLSVEREQNRARWRKAWEE